MILNEKHCHLVVGSVGKVGWIHLVFALGAGETLPVVAPWLRNLLLSLKNLVEAGAMLLLIVILKIQTFPEHLGQTSASPSSP